MGRLYDDDSRRGDRFTRHTDPETSHLAAAKIKRKLTLPKRTVLGLLSYGPLCDNELLARWRENFGSVNDSVPRKRRGDLVADGLVRYAGYTCMYEGSECKVWELTELGREKAP